MKLFLKLYYSDAMEPARSGHALSQDKEETEVVIFGTGRFLRGFVADLLQDARDAGRFGGSAVMVQSTGRDRADALNAAGGRYHVAVRGRAPSGAIDEIREIGVVRRALAAGEDWEELVRLFASAGTRAVFSNVTEHGLVEVEGSRELPAGAPSSFAGKLTALLHARWRTLGEDGSIAVLPCELVDDNGAAVRALVRRTAAAWGLGEGFAGWLDERVAFINTLVDRIVTEPGTRDRLALEARIGRADPLLAVAEPFRMWAVSRALGGREVQGWFEADQSVIVSDDIGALARRKIRLLNGAHTACAPVAALLGVEHFRSFVDDGAGAALLERVVFGEVLPTLEDDRGAGVFARALPDRFCNPHLEHRVLDIASGSVAKARARLLPTMVDAAKAGCGTPGLALGLAALLVMHAPRGVVKGVAVPAVRDEEGPAIGACWAGYALDGTIGSVAEVAMGDGGPLCVPGAPRRAIVDGVSEALGALVRDGISAAVDAAISAGAAGRPR